MGMNWLRLLAAIGLPPLIAVPLAVFFWARRHSGLGTGVGVGVLIAGAVLFAGVEFVESVRFAMWCDQTGAPCPPSNPSDFVRLAAYGFVALLQGWAFLILETVVEPRLSERHVAREWRR